MKKIIFLFIAFFCLIQNFTDSIQMNTLIVEESFAPVSVKKIPIKVYSMPTELELFDTLKSKGFIDPVAVWRIGIWESGHLKSEICKNRNNLFGIKKNDYIYFKSWIECVDYMKKMEDIKWSQYLINNSGDYYDFIHWWGYKTGHSRGVEDLKYVQTIKTLNPPQ